MKKILLASCGLFLNFLGLAQIQLGRDTITVIENGTVLKMPWANGLNYANFSNIDLNADGKKDLVAFDRLNQFGTGRFRCFINTGNAGETKYKPCLDCSYYFPQVVSNWAQLVDYNCDGKEDIFCSTSAGIKVYKNVSSVASLSFQLVKPLIYANINPGGAPSMANLYASTNGLPGIGDIDGDGDMDILTFSPQGTLVQYYKNLAIETYSTCATDSLHFVLADNCWGKFSEGSCSVSFNQQCPDVNGLPLPVAGEKPYHAGATLSLFDSDGDGDKDLVLGDIACNTVEYLHNTGNASSALITDTTKNYPNYPAKGNTTQIRINNFPSVYFVDVDGDARKDLIAAPNVFGSENTKSAWYYHNASTTNTVDFRFIQNNFLQSDMIEVGQNAFPVLFDYNADGKKDLLIGNFGYYAGNTLKSQLTLYENIGTLARPVFSLVTRDYCSLSTYSLNNVMPAVGDVDKDGDTDILIGTSSGQIHWLKNTAGGGNPCNFSTFAANAFSFTTLYAVAAPQLYDLDEDGNLDLVIGNKAGRLAYYRNTGSGTPFVPSFSLVTNFLGDVDVKGSSNLYGLDGYAAPFFYKDNGITRLLVGSVSGHIFYYDVPANISTPFPQIIPFLNFYSEGAQSAPWFEDLDNDGLRDLLLGNAGGGLTYFSSTSTVVAVPDLTGSSGLQVQVFPNPTNGKLTVAIGGASGVSKAVVYDALGRALLSHEFSSQQEVLDLERLEKGVYFLRLQMTSGTLPRIMTKKIIRE